MTTDSFFAEPSPLVWSGEISPVEEFAYSDGAIAVAIGLGVIVASVVSAAVIALFFTLGVMSR